MRGGSGNFLGLLGGCVGNRLGSVLDSVGSGLTGGGRSTGRNSSGRSSGRSGSRCSGGRSGSRSGGRLGFFLLATSGNSKSDQRTKKPAQAGFSLMPSSDYFFIASLAASAAP